MARSALLNVVVSTLTKIGRAVRRDFVELESLQSAQGGQLKFAQSSVVRLRDLLIEQFERSHAGAAVYCDGVHIAGAKDSNEKWYCSLIDGLENFSHAVPLFSSVLTCFRADTCLACAVYNPVMDEMFTAERGKGAHCNDRRMRVSGRTHLSDSMIALNRPGLEQPTSLSNGQGKSRLYELGALLHGTGSAALDFSWTAAGRFDGIYCQVPSPTILDAGMLLLREAGGFAGDSKEDIERIKVGRVIAGNQKIQKELSAAIYGVARTGAS